mgnify:CR=1 FL=1
MLIAQSVGAAAAAHVLMFGLLQRGGRLCIDTVTEHNHVFCYVHWYSGFRLLNMNNAAALGQTLIKGPVMLCQSLCESLLPPHSPSDLRSLYTLTHTHILSHR